MGNAFDHGKALAMILIIEIIGNDLIHVKAIVIVLMME